MSLLQKSNKTSLGLRKLLTAGVHRFEKYSRNFKGLLFDFSRVAIDQ